MKPHIEDNSNVIREFGPAPRLRRHFFSRELGNCFLQIWPLGIGKMYSVIDGKYHWGICWKSIVILST